MGETHLAVALLLGALNLISSKITFSKTEQHRSLSEQKIKRKNITDTILINPESAANPGKCVILVSMLDIPEYL